MRRIMPLLKPKEINSPPALLDVGCAFGPFLEAARDAGCAASGIDVSQEAVEYIEEHLQLPAAAVAFEEFDSADAFGIERYDIITMWYVIEHLNDLQGALKKIHSLLAPGGVFAFSTPNYRGISGRKDFQEYLAASPEDHITIWSPGWAKTILEHHGFALEKIYVTGHHPERFSCTRRKAGHLRTSFLNGISRLFHLGDTFEVYGVKQ